MSLPSSRLARIGLPALLAWLPLSGCRDEMPEAYTGGWTTRPGGFGGASGSAGAGGGGTGGTAATGGKAGKGGAAGGAGASGAGGTGGAAGSGVAGAANPACAGVGTWIDVPGGAEPFIQAQKDFSWEVSDYAWAADGQRFFVAGGTPTGARTAVFDVSTQHWSLQQKYSPYAPARFAGAAAWDGDRVLHFGGAYWWEGPWTNDLGAYYPEAGVWGALPSAPIEARGFTTLVRAGPRFLVWGGLRTAVSSSPEPSKAFASGALYDPIANEWSPMSSMGAPPARGLHAAVWTGTRLLVWGGADAKLAGVGTGGAYDPITDLWTPISAVGAPSPRVAFGWTWASGRLHVWGGAPKLDWPSASAGSGALGDGASYDPATDTWYPINPVGAPSPRSALSLASDDKRLFVWGGAPLTGWGWPFPSGALYDLETETWTPTSGCVGAQQIYNTGTSLSFLGTGFLAAGGRAPPARWFVAP